MNFLSNRTRYKINPMLKIGLTGSIAVGKTFVCDVFTELGCFVSDADEVARKVVEPNTKGLRLIVDEFGEEILTKSGELDRVKLGSIVFNNEPKRKLLNEIVHPLVNDEQDKWMREREKEKPNGIAIVDAALMIESGGYKRFDKIIVVWCDSDIQLKRLMLRNKLTRKEALKRIDVQMSQSDKKRYADFLIDTTKGFGDTRKQTEELFDKLSELN